MGYLQVDIARSVQLMAASAGQAQECKFKLSLLDAMVPLVVLVGHVFCSSADLALSISSEEGWCHDLVSLLPEAGSALNLLLLDSTVTCTLSLDPSSIQSSSPGSSSSRDILRLKARIRSDPC